MTNLSPSDRIAFSFLPVSTSDLAYDIYRKELGQNEASVPGTRFLPREIEPGRITLGDQRIRYAVSLTAQTGYEKIRIGARVNRVLTVEVLRRALEAKCQAPELAADVEVFNRPNPRYHCPFLDDDAEEAVVEGFRALQGLKPRCFGEAYVAAEAATYKASCAEIFNTRWRD